MSLSTCEHCGGHIPLGPDASNRCEGCGRGVFAPASMPPFPDEAEQKCIQFIVRAERAERRVVELEAREQRIRDAAFHPLFNALEARATIRTILNLALKA